MRVLDELDREIERLAVEAGEVRRRRSGARLAVVPLTLAVIAICASTVVLFAERAKDPPSIVQSADSGIGTLIGVGKLLAPRIADPAGGPPWALRMTTTTRGFSCLQLGRTVDGKLGVLGQDGAFHETKPSLRVLNHCQLPDAAGHVFMTMKQFGLPASGAMTGCKPRSGCPAGSLRTVFYGLLGPQATAVTYLDADRRAVRQPVSRPEGAFLVVKPTEPERRNAGSCSPGVSPSSGLRSVEYADGTVCTIPDPRRARPCPLKGYVAPKLPRVSAGELASTVRVSVGTRPEQPPGRVTPKGMAAQRRVTIRFRARVAADARSFYTVGAQIKDGGEGCSYSLQGPIAKDVTVGSVVKYDLWFAYRCAAPCRSTSATPSSASRPRCRSRLEAAAPRRSERRRRSWASACGA